MHSALPGRGALLAAASLLVSLAAAQAPAGYTSLFEGIAGSPTGVDIWDPLQPIGTPGIDNYYWPAGTTSVPHQVFTYAGNTLNVPMNPNGIVQFLAGTGPGGGTTYSRAQRDLSYGCNTGRWTFGTDVLVQFNGTLPATQNVGSLSAQPFPGGQSFIMLLRWSDVTTATTWNADYVWFDSVAAAQLTESVADPGFQNLAVNTWYRWETDVDLTSNRILEVRITDLLTNVTVSNAPLDRYMEGGSLGSAPPTGFRFFAGGSGAGNTIAWDNPRILPGRVVPIPGCNVQAGSMGLFGWPRLGDVATFQVDAPMGGVTPGATLGAAAISLAPGNLPCGLPIPGVTGNVLIGLPQALNLLSLTPWAGPGMPVGVALLLPPAMPAFCPFVGTNLFVQGVLLDTATGTIQLTEGLQLVLGG